MPARRRPSVLAALALAALLALPAPASAQDAAQVERITQDFELGGTISPCRYEDQELQLAQQAALTDPGAFPEGFSGAVGAALAARGRGDCGPQDGAATPAPGGETQAVPPPPGATPTPPPGATPTPAPGDETQSIPPVPGSTPTPGPAITPDPTQAPATGAPAATGGDGIPAAAWILGGAALALALVTLALALVARRRHGGDRLAGVGHAWREAGHRAGGAWLDFSDWLRTGR